MTGITQKEQEKNRKKIDEAIEDSMRESPASVSFIAQVTGLHPSMVHRRFLDLGWTREGGRWVWKHKKSEAE